jgi:hypothetical protein
LRKAYIIARKLKVKDFELWINNELNGYKLDEKIPMGLLGKTGGMWPRYAKVALKFMNDI